MVSIRVNSATLGLALFACMLIWAAPPLAKPVHGYECAHARGVADVNSGYHVTHAGATVAGKAMPAPHGECGDPETDAHCVICVVPILPEASSFDELAPKITVWFSEAAPTPLEAHLSLPDRPPRV